MPFSELQYLASYASCHYAMAYDIGILATMLDNDAVPNLTLFFLHDPPEMHEMLLTPILSQT
jgi:hypothetical protein